jgi:diacylglycerol kinase
LRQRRDSFGHAFRGIGYLLREPHAHLHAVATAVVVILAISLQLSRQDWQSLVLVLALVWLAEGLNTALERLCDAVMPEQHPLIGMAKDLAAGAVLLTAGFAVVMAALIFVPYL